MTTKEFSIGTVARCNRCDKPSPLPKQVFAVQEKPGVWRSQDMATLACGHMDAHWIYERDNKKE